MNNLLKDFKIQPTKLRGENMLDENELLFDELYEKTKDCGRVQFIKLLMSKERENKILRENAEHNDKVVDKVNWENKRLYELCMYALISSTKIYNHELAINTKQAFVQIIKENLQEDTFTIRDKIKKYWETGDK